MKTLIAISILNATAVLAATGQAADHWFETRDLNGNGQIPFEELYSYAQAAGAKQGKVWSKETVQRKFNSCDTNRDGTITPDESPNFRGETSKNRSTDFVYCPNNEHYYKAVHTPEGISWSKAKAEAEKAGGYLATITSEAENKFVFYLIKDARYWTEVGPFDHFGPWLGGCQDGGSREPDRGWQWITGEEFFYANWAPMEPSGRWKGKDENRLQFYRKGNQRFPRWNDTLDTPEGIPIRGYVIEKGNPKPQPPDTVVTEVPNGLHDFLAQNGNSTRGRVVAYNAPKGTVTIEKKDKLTCKVKLAQLSKADQTHVREWHLIKEFCTKNRFRISAKQKQCGENREMEIHDNQGVVRGIRTMESIGYDITLDNRTRIGLRDMDVEYCIYYEQDRPNGLNRVAGRGVKCGTLNISKLAAKSTTQVETEPVVLFKQEKNNDYGDGNVLKGEITGIWIRVYLPLANGKRTMREYSKPAELMKDRQWATSDIQASKMRQ